MLFPIGDDNADRHTTPVVNYVLIAINILVFIFLQGMGDDMRFTLAYSTVPAEIISGQDVVTAAKSYVNPYTGDVEHHPGLGVTNLPVYLTLITSMFMHGGWAHLAGNMLYLWIFGDNIENAMGHKKYLLFYLICGVLAALAHVLTTVYFNQRMDIPSLGASGAISGVLAGYMLLFPRRSVHVWLLWGVTSVPALVVVGLWFVFQVVNGMGALGGEEAGGIAYAAHIGGFIAGLLLVKFFSNSDITERRETF